MATAVEIVTELYRRFRTGEDPFALLADDVVWEVDTLDAPAEAYRGHRGVAEFFRRWLGTWDDYEIELEEVREAPDGRVVAFFVERATGRGSGVPVEMRPTGVMTVRDDKIVAYRGYANRADALSDAGL